jgi:hypothetical protein
MLLSLIILEVNLQRMLLLLILCRAREVDKVTTVLVQIVVNITTVHIARAGHRAVETKANDSMVVIVKEVVGRIRQRATGAGSCCLSTDKWCAVRGAQVAQVTRKRDTCSRCSEPRLQSTTATESSTMHATRVIKLKD